MRLSPILPASVAGTFVVLAGCEGESGVDGKSMIPPPESSGEAGEVAKTDVRTNSSPDEGGAPSKRLESHQHGHARLAAAVDGDQLTFTFEAPLASLAGFEHAPETAEQRATLEALKDAFVTPGSMVSLNAEARCLPMTTSSGTHMSGGHGALEVEHVYNCERPSRITAIEFLLMEDYPALESIEAIFLSQTTQSAGQLRPGKTVLEVR